MGKIVVIGSGTMGTGIAAIFVAAGHDVVLLGRQLPSTQARLPAILTLAATLPSVGPHGQPTAAAVDDWNAWDGVELVIETIAEDLPAKQALFAQLDQRVPAHIPIGSNSSGFGIDEMTAGLATADRMLKAMLIKVHRCRFSNVIRR